MRTLLVIAAIVFSFQGFSKDSAKGEKWKTHRDKSVTRMTERKAMIQKIIDCMSAATTKEAFKGCKETAKKSRDAFKSKYPRKKD